MITLPPLSSAARMVSSSSVSRCGRGRWRDVPYVLSTMTEAHGNEAGRPGAVEAGQRGRKGQGPISHGKQCSLGVNCMDGHVYSVFRTPS